MTEPVDQHFLDTVRAFVPSTVERSTVDGDRLLALFEAQLGSRHLDLAARALGRRGEGFYSIGSSGHEGNAAVAAALRVDDPALLHYRSGAFYLARAAQYPGATPLRDVLLGLTAAAAEPISGGRHKVFGHHALSVIPQTSTIASHLPRAVGVAFGIERARKLGLRTDWPTDAITVCTFGDASANHSTAAGAINTATHCAYQRLPLPILFVCEDNGIGISVRTPANWIRAAYENRPGLRYFEADGGDLEEALAVAREAADWVRTRRAPAFLRLRTVRLMGHAGSDVESAYRTQTEITADLDRDPVLRTALLLARKGLRTPAELLTRYEEIREQVATLAAEATREPTLSSAAEVLRPLTTPPTPRPPITPTATQGLTLAQSVNQALSDLLSHNPATLVFGEDVGAKGGVYGVTRGLRKTHGAARVFDTLLDEQTILGTALGTALCGFLPVPEIQYLAYLHNAADQLRGEAATLRFFSNTQYANPMIVRIAGLAYQRGFGGHFHNDNALAALRDIPGLVIAVPSRGDDAAAMLHTCAESGQVCVFLEPIALYHTKDLHTPGDNAWLSTLPGHAPLGRARTHGQGQDLTILTFGNGVPMTLRAAHRLGHTSRIRVVDLRWLSPLPLEDILRESEATGRVLIVDETRRTGGVSEQLTTALVDANFTGQIRRITSEDTFIPLGPAANHVLLSEADIEKAITDLLA